MENFQTGNQNTQPKILTLSNSPQIIDINGDFTNFEVNIEITAVSNEKDIYGNQQKTNNKFLFSVTTQQNVDQNGIENLEYKQSIDGKASFGMKMDKGVYNSYILVLKSIDGTFPVKLDMKISGERIENLTSSNGQESFIKPKGFFTMKNIVIGIIVLGVIGAGIYFFYIKKKGDKNSTSLQNKSIELKESESPVKPNVKTPKETVKFDNEKPTEKRVETGLSPTRVLKEVSDSIQTRQTPDDKQYKDIEKSLGITDENFNTKKSPEQSTLKDDGPKHTENNSEKPIRRYRFRSILKDV